MKCMDNPYNPFFPVVIDYAKDSSSSTGKFECIYRQPMTIPRYRGALDLYVRGLALPNDYFYKRDIDLRETYDLDEDIGEENNIKAILDKIKHAYDTDTIMVEPEDDSNFLSKMEKETTTHDSRSDNELNIAATVITAQLDELMNRIVSEHNLKSRPAEDIEFESPDLGTFHLTPTHEAPDIKITLGKALEEYVSTGAIDMKESFGSDELDNGPLDNASFDGVNSPTHVYNYFKQLMEFKLMESNSTESTSLTTDLMREAATKLINFIKTKEQECCNE